jgi:Zn-dependent protease with chaperone function
VEIAAKFNDGKTAKTHAVKASFDENVLFIIDADGGQIASCPLDNLRIVDKGDPQRPVRLKFGADGQERLGLARREDLSAIEAICLNLYQSSGDIRRQWRTVVVASLGAILSIFVIVQFGIPLFAGHVAKIVPLSSVQRVGDQVHGQIIKAMAYLEKRPASEMLCSDPEGLALVKQLTATLIAEAEDAIPVKISVINSKIVNAAALPGGRIIIFRGLLEFVENEGELASVLAHEFGHVQSRHPTKNAIQGATLGVLTSLLIGDVAGGFALTGLSSAVLQSAYSRDAEREADAIALEIMKKVRLDIEDSARFFKRLQEKTGDNKGIISFLSTHPPLQERVDTAKERARTQKRGAQITKILTRAEWAKVKTMCQ